MTCEEARAIMVKAQEWDGVAEIRANGDVVLTEEAYTTFRQMLNVDQKIVTVDDSYAQAKELRSKFEEFARKQGVQIPT